MTTNTNLGSVIDLTDMDDSDAGKWSGQEVLDDSDELDFEEDIDSAEGSEAEAVFGLAEQDDSTDEGETDDADRADELPLPPLPPQAGHQTFRHEPLANNCIRLLEIKPGRNYDDLRCRLHHVDLDEQPKYVAISYRWGTTKERAALSIKSETLNIMPNAYWALFFQRRIRQRLFIWIDCICIDQQNVLERNHQVALMARIFSQARIVYIWLGLPQNALHDALGWAEQNSRSPLLYGADATVIANAEHILRPFFELEYWSSIWIIQEIVFGQEITILVGTRRLSWRKVERMKALLDQVVFGTAKRHENSSQSMATVLHLINQRRGGYGGSPNFAEFLNQYRLSRCSDARDKIYGLVEIWNKQVPRRFEPDYSKTVFDLLMTAYAYVFKNNVFLSVSKDCKILLETLNLDLASAQLQSWLVAKSVRSGQRLGFPQYAMSLDNGDLLTLPPVMLRGTTSYIAHIRHHPIAEETHTDFDDWIKMCLEDVRYSWSTAWSGTTDALPGTPLDHLQTINQAICQGAIPWAHRFAHWKASQLHKRADSGRIFIDNNGYLGIASPEACEGDICVLYSTNFYLLFNDNNNSSVTRHYEIVGSAYITGVTSDGLQDLARSLSDPSSDGPQSFRLSGGDTVDWKTFLRISRQEFHIDPINAFNAAYVSMSKALEAFDG